MKRTLFLMTIFAAQSLMAADATAPAVVKPPAGMSVQVEKTNGAGPVQDRFTTPDDGRVGMEARAILIETLGPDHAKGVILIIDKGDVQLNGSVPSEEKKRAVIEALTKTKGVKSVNNKLATPANSVKK